MQFNCSTFKCIFHYPVPPYIQIIKILDGTCSTASRGRKEKKNKKAENLKLIMKSVRINFPLEFSFGFEKKDETRDEGCCPERKVSSLVFFGKNGI